MANVPYSTAGRYRTGVWLIVKGDKTYIVPRSRLPAHGTGWKYYWLGASQDQVQGRLGDALDKLGAQDPQSAAWTGRDFTPQIDAALHGQVGSFGSRIGFLQKILNAAGSAGVPSPGAIGGAASGGLGGAGGAADAGATGGAATAGAEGGVAGSVASAITSPLAFLALIAWIFHPRNVLRMVEFLTGIVLMVFGLWAAFQARGERIEGFTTSESSLSRSGLGRVARELARSSERSSRVQSAPHSTRRKALRQRYQREESLATRKAKERRQRNRSNT